MFIVQQKIDSVWQDWTAHSQSNDAVKQIQILTDSGLLLIDLQTVEKETYLPLPGKTL